MSDSIFLVSTSLTGIFLCLLKITLVLGTAWIVHSLLKRMNSRWRILVWRISAIGLCCVVLLSIKIPLFTLPLLPAISAESELANTVTSTNGLTHSVAERVVPLTSSTRNQSGGDTEARQIPRDSITADSLLIAEELTQKTTAGKLAESADDSQSNQPFSKSFWSLSGWLLLIWIVGVGVRLVRTFVGTIYVAKIGRSASTVPEWVEAELARIASQNLNVHNISVKTTEAMGTPCSIGILRNTILLSKTLCEKSKLEELRAVLAHEVAHIAGHDLRWNLVLHLISVLLWFHPLAWRIRLAHVDACDERCDAIAAHCMQDVDGYSQLLAKVALQMSGQTPTSALTMARSSRISNRIKMIRSEVCLQDLPNWMTRTVSTAAVALMLLIGTSGLSRSIAETTNDSQLVNVDVKPKNPEPKQVKQIALSKQTNEKENAPIGRDKTEIEPVPLQPDQPAAPQLIAVWPGDKAENVDRNTELHLRFDQPIDPLSFKLEWKQGSYLQCGQTRYLKKKNEMIIPVRLEAACEHKIVINAYHGIQRAKGFMSNDGKLAISTEWKFHTKANRPPANGKQPKVISIFPPTNSKVARVISIRVRFDQEMDPLLFNLSPTARATLPGRNIELNTSVSYDEQNNEFVFPVVLPENWTGQIELSGLQNLNGTQAESIIMKYSTGNQVENPEKLNRALPRESVAKLRNVVEGVHRFRASLHSVSETVRSVTMDGHGRQGSGFSQLEGNWSRFKMQGNRQFYGDVSRVIGVPFQVGSDGTQCWFFSHRRNKKGEKTPTVISCDYKEIQNKYLNFLTPFHFDGSNLDQAIKDRHLEYLGVQTINDTKCHLIKSWKAQKLGNSSQVWIAIHTWWIDSKTFRPVQLSTDMSGTRNIKRFQYDSINKKLPISEFQPTITPQTVKREPEPLGDGYDARFIKLSDGTNGRTSCRWGKTGKKGRSSSGLN